MTTSARRWVVASAGLCVLLGALDTYVVVSLLGDIVRDIGIPVNRLERATPIVTGYLLGYVAAMPLLGQASDRLGRKPLLQLCLVLFAVGSAVTAVGATVTWLVAGRTVQGIAGGALLPVTMALVADLWSQQRRAEVLGVVGAAQELGSVFGPFYGIGLAALTGWRGVFWVNLPLTAVAIVAVQVIVPRQPREKTTIDLVGGALLAATLGLLVAGLQNPDPNASAFAPWAIPVLSAAAVCLVALVAWERWSSRKLLDPAGVALRPLAAALGVSLLAGAALMATLVDIELIAQAVLGRDRTSAALTLLPFLAALPIAAVLGGVLATRFGDRPITVAGMLVAAGGYWLVSGWSLAIASSSYPLGLPRMVIDLIIAGAGLGLIIAPISAVALRTVPATRYGTAAAAVVVARMTGMLVGIAALSTFGLHRFHSLTSSLNPPLPMQYQSNEDFERALATYRASVDAAQMTEYDEIFAIVAVLCIIAAFLALLIRVRDRAAGETGHPSKRMKPFPRLNPMV
ncbi:MFS transporter [Skermania sp. ID1734]|uniref:MFS transporter n=1 Tax=Skermania sp. ID1734 TaxID=2597516 RepID=UPI0011804F9F|nr:MFS transporter [Skermania sp. ID1734]TSE01492.1 MFS transporter [Skermania sp. ID1734]